MNGTQYVVDAVLTGTIGPLGEHGKRSAIGKLAVSARVWLAENGFDGDQQAESKHHGGPEKALHHYPFDHYAVWRGEWSNRGRAGSIRRRARHPACSL